MKISKVSLIYIIAVYIFLFSPLFVVIVSSFNADDVVQFPPKNWSLNWYGRALLNQDFLDSLIYSTQAAFFTMVFSMILGVPAALSIVRYSNRITKFARTLALLPLTFSHAIIGLALLEFFLITLRLQINMWCLVAGHTLICIPFVVQIVGSSIYGFNRTHEEAARTLGATPLQTMFKITLPIIKPGLVTAAVFSFIISFDDVGISLFLTAPGKVTIPIRMFQYVETHYDPTIAVISTFLIIYAMVMLVLLQRLGTLDQVFRG